MNQICELFIFFHKECIRIGNPQEINSNSIISVTPGRSCLVSDTTIRKKRKRVKFANDVVNNEQASKNAMNNKHVLRYTTPLYYITD